MLTIDGKSASPITVKYRDDPKVCQRTGIGYVETNSLGDYVLARIVPGATIETTQRELNNSVDYLIPWSQIIWVSGR